MKLKFNYLNKLLILIVLVFTSCQKEDLTFEEPLEASNQLFNIKRIETVDLNSIDNIKIKEKLNALKAYKPSKGSTNIARENWEQIIIDTSSVKFIETEEGYDSYTFDVLNSEAHHYIENIIISHFPNDSIKTILATYYLNDSLDAIPPENIEEQITQTTFTLLDGTTQIIESYDDAARVADCVVIGYWDEEEICKGGEAGFGDDMCNDENGEPITVDVFVVIDNSCDWDNVAYDGSPVNGSAGSDDQGPVDDEPHNGGNNASGETLDLPDSFVLTAPKINIANELIEALGFHKNEDSDIIAFIRDNYQKLTGEHHGLIEESFAYLMINDFSETAIDNVEKSLRVLSGLEEVSSLNTISVNEYFLNLIGGRLTKMNETIFPEHAEAWSDIDTNRNLESGDWLIIAEIGFITYTDYLYNGESFNHDRAEENAMFIAYLSSVKSMVGEHWPQTDEQWSALGSIMGQFMIEIGLALIPGSDIIEVANGITDGDYVAVTLGIVGLVIDAFGGVLLKAVAKIGKVAYKTFKIFKIVFRYLDEVVDAITLGLKTELTDFGVVIKNQAGKIFGRIFNNILTLKYSGFGGDIVTTQNKTTTLIGRWDNQLEELWESGLAKQGENIGGVNILGNPPNGTIDEVWSFNKNWLNQAMSRGDKIRVTANPTDASNIIYNNIDNVSFDSFDDVILYMNSFDEFSAEFSNLGYFGKEVHTLISNGYSFNPLTNLFEL